MQPGDIATFVERPGVEYNALVVEVEIDGANIIWLAPDSTRRWRPKQATFPFFKDGMTARYISTPIAVEPDPIDSFVDDDQFDDQVKVDGAKDLEPEGPSQPDTTEDVDDGKSLDPSGFAGNEEGPGEFGGFASDAPLNTDTTGPDRGDEESDIDGLGPLAKGQVEELK